MKDAARRKVNIDKMPKVKGEKYSPAGEPSRPSGPSGEYTVSGVTPSNLQEDVSQESRVEMRPAGPQPSSGFSDPNAIPDLDDQ